MREALFNERDDMGPIRTRRHSIRLKGYDYACAGAYFVTLCTQDRVLFFDNELMRAIAERSWVNIPVHFPMVELDEWVVMPNHLHGIIVITEDNGRGVQLNAPTIADTDGSAHVNKRDAGNPFSVISPRRKTLSVAVRTYKGAVTTACRRAGHTEFGWQRNYYERIIRNEGEINRIRQYIRDNPARWDTDENNPDSRY